MRVGVQFSRSIPAGATRRYFTHSWPEAWHVMWYVVPTSPQRGAPQIEWNIQVERASSTHFTYWIIVKNLTSDPVNIEGRYVVLN